MPQLFRDGAQRSQRLLARKERLLARSARLLTRLAHLPVEAVKVEAVEDMEDGENDGEEAGENWHWIAQPRQHLSIPSKLCRF